MASRKRRLAWGVACVAALVMAPAATALAACATETATGLYTRAHHAFEEKRFDESVDLLRQAYACAPNPVYLADVARTYEEAKRPRDALASWRVYLDAATDEQERTRTRGRISALSKVLEDLDRAERERAAAEEAQRRAEAQAHEREESKRASATRIAPGAWVTAGIGAGGLITGAVLGALASARHSSAVDERDAVAAEGLQSDAHRFASAANWAFVIGGALVATGGAWMAVDLVRRPRDERAGSVSLVMGAHGVALTGVFE